MRVRMIVAAVAAVLVANVGWAADRRLTPADFAALDGRVERLASEVDALKARVAALEGTTSAAPCPCGPGCDCDGDCTSGCPAKTATDPRRTTVYVRQNLGGAFACGTGTVIGAEAGQSLILTNAHVVESGANPVEVVHITDGQSWIYPARYLAGSSVVHTGPQTIDVHGPDLCLLVVDFELPAAEIAAGPPAIGTRVYQFGFGGRADNYPPSEKAGAVIPGRFGDRVLATTIRSQSGDSGSGIFDDRGRLVGVCWGGDEHQCAVPLAEVHTFTVATLTQRKGLFARLRDRLAARQIARALGRPAQPAQLLPSQSTAPFMLPSCPNGRCPAQR